MKKAVQRFFSLFTKNKPPRKSRAQSLVEVAIAFPILIMLFGGVVEFGFILNFYLSLLDATRDSARYWSQDDPFLADGVTDDDDFYYQTAYDVQKVLDPTINNPSYKGRRVLLDPAKDDVIVSVYGAEDSNVILWRDAGPYHLFPTPGHVSGNYPSIFTLESIEDSRVTNAPNAGILVVEIHYNYHQVLNLPWMTAFLPNPLHLQAYSIMPIRSGEPE
jgi:hypothetical protein